MPEDAVAQIDRPEGRAAGHGTSTVAVPTARETRTDLWRYLRKGRRTLAKFAFRRPIAAANEIYRTMERWAVGVSTASSGRKIPRSLRLLSRAAWRIWPVGSIDLDRLISESSKILGPLPAPVAGRVVEFSIGLGSGGSERQLVTTLAGLTRHEGVEPIVLLRCDLDDGDSDFFLDEVRQLGTQYHVVPSALPDIVVGQGAEQTNVPEPMRQLLPLMREIPSDLASKVLNALVPILELRPSVVHVWGAPIGASVAIAAKIAGVPRIVVAVRNMAPVQPGQNFRPYWRGIYQKIVDDPQIHFVSNSEAGATEFSGWLGRPRENLKVIYNGLDPEQHVRPSETAVQCFRRKLSIPPGAILVAGMFSMMLHKKDPVLWVKAAVHVALVRDNVHFVLYGKGKVPVVAERLIRKHKLNGRIRFGGTTKESATAIGAADLLLHTAVYEGTPNVVAEAQWLGVPVVATGGGGVSETLADGRTGRFLPSASDRQLADALIELIDHPDMRRRMALEGPRFVSERFGFDRMIDETLALYGVPSTSS